jgi:DNA-binding NarL/FixJ family response regulator
MTTREKKEASPRVLIADAHGILRDGLKLILLRQGFEIVGEASNGLEAVALTRKQRPDVVVLGIALPQLNGIDAARDIHRQWPTIKTIVLTMFNESHYVLDAFRAGVNGYVLKTQFANDLVQAIQSVLAGRTYISPAVSEDVARIALAKTSTEPITLSLREREVLQLIAEGKSNKQIGVLLAISAKTVDGHRRSLMGKLQIHETAGLVRYAVRIGLIQP